MIKEQRVTDFYSWTSFRLQLTRPCPRDYLLLDDNACSFIHVWSHYKYLIMYQITATMRRRRCVGESASDIHNYVDQTITIAVNG